MIKRAQHTVGTGNLGHGLDTCAAVGGLRAAEESIPGDRARLFSSGASDGSEMLAPSMRASLLVGFHSFLLNHLAESTISCLTTSRRKFCSLAMDSRRS